MVMGNQRVPHSWLELVMAMTKLYVGYNEEDIWKSLYMESLELLLMVYFNSTKQAEGYLRNIVDRLQQGVSQSEDREDQEENSHLFIGVVSIAVSSVLRTKLKLDGGECNRSYSLSGGSLEKKAA